jgi:hypothetical protein
MFRKNKIIDRVLLGDEKAPTGLPSRRKGNLMLIPYLRKSFETTLLILAVTLALAQPSEANPESKPVLIFGAGVSRHRDSGEFYQGEPIFIHVGMRRTDSNDMPQKEGLQIGTEKLPWYKNISVYLYKVEEVFSPNTVPPLPVTAPHTTKKTLLKNVPIKLVRQPKKHKLLKVNKKTWSSWAIAPNLTSRLLPGKYVIEATLNTTKLKGAHPQIFHENYQSNEVSIVINRPKTDQAKAEILIAQATYSGRHQKYDDKIKLLKQALKLNSARGDIRCGLGDAYQAIGDPDNAIKEYRAYVQWVRSLNLPRTGKGGRNEHADLIEQMVKNMEQRREKKK